MGWIGWDGLDGYPIPLWHQEHRSRAMLTSAPEESSKSGIIYMPNICRSMRFSWGRIWFERFALCKRFDIMKPCDNLGEKFFVCHVVVWCPPPLETGDARGSCKWLEMNIGKLWWTNIARSIDRYWQILRKTCMLLLVEVVNICFVHLDWKLGSLLLTNWDCLHFKKESQQAAVKSPPQGWILGELFSIQLSLVMLWNLFHGCYLVVWQEPSADMWPAHYPALSTHTSTSPTGALLSQAAIEGELPLTSSYTQKRRLTEGHPDLFLVHSVLIIFLEQ